MGSGMRLTSAGNAWHMAFYTPGREPDNGVMVQQTSKQNTSVVAMNHAVMGVVQSAIAMLPVPLQIVGHWIYAPIDTGAQYENYTWAIIATRGGVHKEQPEMYFLAHAACHAYKDMAIGKPAAIALNQPQDIKKWLLDRHSVSIDSKNWRTKYRFQWDRYISVLNDLDKKALGPVAAAINKANEEVDLELDSFKWGNELVNFSRMVNK